MDDSYPVRAQVLDSFLTYCKAARKFFPSLSNILVNQHPIIEKEMIDNPIGGMNKYEMAPLEALSDHLRIIECPNPINLGSCLIYDCVEMIPVRVETQQLKINEGLFIRLAKEEGYLKLFEAAANQDKKTITAFIHASFAIEIFPSLTLKICFLIWRTLMMRFCTWLNISSIL